jgi:tetratricopeptide (TPR) repeat protein
MITCCPGPVELARIGRGTADGSCPPEFATHIEECPRCREFLERCAVGGLETWNASQAGGLRGPAGLPRIDGFTIERELGRGAMGVVYLARRDAPRRLVALKLWPGGRRASDRERRQWLREAEAAAVVRHPNIVTLYEAGVTDDWFLLALEYVPAGTLADRLTEPLAPRTAASLAETIARAVQHIHRSGLLHLDLKPSNILLDGDAAAGWGGLVPKVSDFGIAREIDSAATDTGGAGPGGTPSYMAPEQITRPRGDMTAQADIHGLGAILYHMLTGRPPYQGATVLETIDQVRRLEPVPPHRFSAAIPRDLETICLKCLNKDPGRRYASAEALADDLGRWLDGRPISARPVSAAEKSWRWCRRRPVIAALAVALLLTLSAGFVAVIALWRRAEANFRMSAEMVGDLVDLVAGGEENLPRIMTFDHLIPILEQQRKRLIVLAANRPGDLLIARRLVRIEYRLSVNLIRTKRHEEARIVLLESLGRIEELIRRHPSETALLLDLRSCLGGLSGACERLGKTEESIQYRRRDIQSYEEEIRRSPMATCLARLIQSRRNLALLLYSQGDLAEAGSLVDGSRRLLENLPDGCEGPTLPVQRLLCRIDCLALLPDAAAETSPEAGDVESRSVSPLSYLASPTDASQPPEDWARIAARAIRCDDPDRRAASYREAEDALTVIDRLTGIASRMRRLDDAEGAKRIAERMLALANHVVAAHPRQPASYLALSYAYAQIYKNAYLTKDGPAIEVNMRSARDAAQKALLLDLNSERAWNAVDDFQRRLADLHPND